MPRIARGPLRSCAASASRRARVSVRRTFRRPSVRPPCASTFIRSFPPSVSSPTVSVDAAPPFTRLWSGATARHRRVGEGDSTLGADLKTFWLKAPQPPAVVLWRGPFAPCRRRAAQPRPSPLSRVLPGKLAQVASLYAAFARGPDSHRRPVGNAERP